MTVVPCSLSQTVSMGSARSTRCLHICSIIYIYLLISDIGAETTSTNSVRLPAAGHRVVSGSTTDSATGPCRT